MGDMGQYQTSEPGVGGSNPSRRATDSWRQKTKQTFLILQQMSP
jgi:hypothetical protein